MRKLSLAGVVAFMVPLACFAQSDMSNMAAPSVKSGTNLSTQDRKFIKLAAEAGLFEVKEGQLAATKGDNAVQNIANHMVADHTKANDQLKSLAGSKGVTIADHMNTSQTSESDKLQTVSGTEFDEDYLSDQRLAHQKAITLFEAEANSGSDSDLKNFASTTLPVLKMHLKMIEDAKQSEAKASG